jgi:hypothetical protein
MFSFFVIKAHIEIYFNVRIAFLDDVHYKTLNTRLAIYLLVINPPKPTRGPRCTFRYVDSFFRFVYHLYSASIFQFIYYLKNIFKD